MNLPNKNHLEILKDIISLLKNNGFEKEKILLENEISASSTGGEICMRCCSLLLTLNKQKNIKKVIGELTSELIDYCHSIGLEPVAMQIKNKKWTKIKASCQHRIKLIASVRVLTKILADFLLGLYLLN